MIARESKTSKLEDYAETKKVGQGEYASVKDSPKGNQLKNTDGVVGTA
ncbi:MAG TPA: hypothetical protein VFZ67_04600 [Nitrososphaera sp.]